MTDGLHDIVAELIHTAPEGKRIDIPLIQISDWVDYKTCEHDSGKAGTIDSIEFFPDGTPLVYISGENLPISISDIISFRTGTRLHRFKLTDRYNITAKIGDSHEQVTDAFVVVQGSSNPDVVYFTDPQRRRLFKAIIRMESETNKLSQPGPYSTPMGSKLAGPVGSYGGPSS